jgi:hypothetical protein
MDQIVTYETGVDPTLHAALGPFKKAYNNYRDDHDQFRKLTQCSRVLEVAAEQIVVHLMPRVNYAPRSATWPALGRGGVTPGAPEL